MIIPTKLPRFIWQATRWYPGNEARSSPSDQSERRLEAVPITYALPVCQTLFVVVVVVVVVDTVVVVVFTFCYCCLPGFSNWREPKTEGGLPTIPGLCVYS